MEATKSFSCAFFFFSSLRLLYPISCGLFLRPGETQTESTPDSNPRNYCIGYQEQCITECQSQGRQVSEVECNYWRGNEEQAVCKCCCGLPSSTPPPEDIYWNQCPSGETNKKFMFENTDPDYNFCVNGCKSRCDEIGATMTRKTCVPSTRPRDRELHCPCCKPQNPPPSPTPSPPPPPPIPTPSPPPPTPAAFSCDPSTEVYVGANKTEAFGHSSLLCKQCPGDIRTSCNSKGRKVSKIECNWWDINGTERTTVCLGCCGAPLPTPPPVITDQCQAGDADGLGTAAYVKRVVKINM
ncbi:hypothetical protein MKX01_041313 [Papaver californicum]|nr:hypothetical protein MKX01_041313 [Papaver californicum]